MAPPRPVRDRLTESVQVDGNGCWIWQKYINPKTGYGDMKVAGRSRQAHRVAWETLKGPIPPGLVIDHLCRVPACVNPDHLEPVTQRINLLRGRTFQAANAAKTHCQQGHPFDEENTYVYQTRDGVHRACRLCRSAASDRYLARKREPQLEGRAGMVLRVREVVA